MPYPHDLPGDIAGLQPDLLRVARHLTGGADQAQDLSQEVLMKLCQKQARNEPIENLRAYAMTTLRNAFRQHLRNTVPGAELEENMLTAPPDAFACLALREISQAIEQLPDSQARLIRLVAEGETSPAELARITGVPVGTAMSRLARARVQLRAAMGLKGSTPVAELM